MKRTPVKSKMETSGESGTSAEKPSSLITFPFLLVLLIYGALSFGIHREVNLAQPKPYMDEIFHVPQCQKYCRGLYSEWDPKITTLPGTYIVATAFLRSLEKVLPMEDPCSTFNLRTFNLAVSVFNLLMIYVIVSHYSPNLSSGKRALSALNIAIFPVMYFFSFLYYTDAVSTAFLLLMHCLYLNGRYGFSAMAGGASVMTRQTNIVWVMFHGISCILQVLIEAYGEDVYLFPMEYGKLAFNNPQNSKPKKGKRAKGTKRPKKASSPHLPSMFKIWQDCGEEFADRGYAYVLVGVAFIAFVVYNGSIVVGDKDAHQVTFNFPQIGYFAVVFGAFTAPFILFRIKPLVMSIYQYPMNPLLFAMILGGLIYDNTPVHPYLLADNRHYTFYIWKRFYESVPCFRYLWIPLYVAVWGSIFQNMGVQKAFLCAYFMCTIANIVPQLLMEFRYFIPAYLFARPTFKHPSWFELLLEFLLNLGVNLITVYLFLNKPFKWPDSEEVQRFMW